MIRPITGPHGVGFFSNEQLPDYAKRYREVNVGRIWNYYVTPECQDWPEWFQVENNYVIDGFSPNLNKELHAGHLRQLAVANSLKCLLKYGGDSGEKISFVSLLGASQGVYKTSTDALEKWFEFLDFKPELYYDVLMPRDLVECRRQGYKDDTNTLLLEEHELPWVWEGPNGPVKVKRYDGSPLYAFHDLAFAKLVGPTHYITGAEQKEHFASLGLGDKHLPMGLVLGSDGKKLKSRASKEGVPADSPKAEAIMEEVMENLEDSCPDKRKLAWNVLAWNFLTVARTQNVKYNPADWTKADAPGLYITYTFARVKKALGKSWYHFPPHTMKAMKLGFGDEEMSPWESKKHPDPYYDLTQDDADLIGFANYFTFYHKRCVETMDSTQMANFAHDLARRLGKAYHKEKINDGRYGFQYAINHANTILQRCMWTLGMFRLEQV